MNDKELIDLLENQLIKLESAGVHTIGDRKFFLAGEWELAIEGVFVASRKHPGLLDQSDVQILTDAFDVDVSELDHG